MQELHEHVLEAHAVGYAVDGVAILRGVDFALRAGELVGLIGPNGAGKSTLLKLLAGVWRASSGDIRLRGKPLASYPPRQVARQIAYVPQAARLDFSFLAREVALMGRSPHLNRFQMESAHDRAIAEEALAQADALHLAERLANHLSGGEQQRVTLARALTQQPRILLLDEPTSNLDVRHQLDVLTLAQQQAHVHGWGVLAAVHDLGMAARFCDRLVLLYDGMISADGSPEAVLTPGRLRDAFAIDARLYTDPHTGRLALSVS